MDDLLGEDWQKPAKSAKPTTPVLPNTSAFASSYSGFRSSPQPSQSGNASPLNLSRPSSTVNGAKSSPSDSFGNLLASRSQKANRDVSMQERQRQLIEEKRRQQEDQAQLWDNLGSGRGTPEIRQPSPAPATAGLDDEDDILAAFNKDAPVDAASHFAPPPASGPASGTSTPAARYSTSTPAPANEGFGDDDDPFGLSSMPRQSNGHAKAPAALSARDEDDDILGDLGKPVAERPPVESQSVPDRASEPVGDEGDEDINEDKALAELVEMGFPTETARIALVENGGNVQDAVGWLLQQAHEESRQKSRSETQSRRRSPPASSRSPPGRRRAEQEAVPAWMRQEGRSSSSRRQDGDSSVAGEKDAAQMAQDFGNKLFKSANSLWKASQKQMARTMADLQQDRDSSQPKWMREASADSSRSNSQRRPDLPARPPDVTDEAAMLDGPRARPQKPPRPTAPEGVVDPPTRGRSPVEPLPHRPSSQPRFMQQAPPQTDRRPVAKLSRHDVEEQSAQAYVSPARRKRPIPNPEPRPEPEVDLFSAPAPVAGSAPPKATQTPSISKRPAMAPRPSPASSKPTVPPRSIPPVSPAALATSASHRKAGGEHFKRGDYAAAHESYTGALNPLPASHPIAIIVLSNRSLTALKTGDAKMAVSDADRALELIGPGLGAGETIDLGAGEGMKPMKEFHGKALMRKAEALEHMEKYSDAASVWRQAIEAGFGGAVSLKGRDRCEKAAAPRPHPSAPKPVRSSAPAPGKAPPAKGLGNSMQRPTITSVSSGEAVKKLRAANAAADKADDEKFALTDTVDAKLTAWKGGKADNLRALLQSMDAVLWEGAGWKKVGMSDLVMPNKVKVVYMKAIGKVHPDKIPQDATTEQRMVSAAVFATLNEAWDKFRKENNL